MDYQLREVESLENPVMCCGFCGAPVFILPKNIEKDGKIIDAIMSSTAIPPQQQPTLKQMPECKTCGKRWLLCNFTLVEGGPCIGKNGACN